MSDTVISFIVFALAVALGFLFASILLFFVLIGPFMGLHRYDENHNRLSYESNAIFTLEGTNT